MILVDANLLLYARVSSFSQHARAREWLDGQLNGTAPVGLPWPSLLGFLRIVTNPRVFERPEAMADAWRQVAAWLNCDVVWVPQATERHAEILAALLTGTGVTANLVPDAGGACHRARTRAALNGRRLRPLSENPLGECPRLTASVRRPP